MRQVKYCKMFRLSQGNFKYNIIILTWLRKTIVSIKRFHWKVAHILNTFKFKSINLILIKSKFS